MKMSHIIVAELKMITIKTQSDHLRTSQMDFSNIWANLSDSLFLCTVGALPKFIVHQTVLTKMFNADNT